MRLFGKPYAEFRELGAATFSNTLLKRTPINAQRLLDRLDIGVTGKRKEKGLGFSVCIVMNFGAKLGPDNEFRSVVMNDDFCAVECLLIHHYPLFLR